MLEGSWVVIRLGMQYLDSEVSLGPGERMYKILTNYRLYCVKELGCRFSIQPEMTSGTNKRECLHAATQDSSQPTH